MESAGQSLRRDGRQPFHQSERLDGYVSADVPCWLQEALKDAVDAGEYANQSAALRQTLFDGLPDEYLPEDVLDAVEADADGAESVSSVVSPPREARAERPGDQGGAADGD